MYEEEQKPVPKWLNFILYLAFVLWTVAGIGAFIISLVCFGSTGTMTQKIFGFLLALFFGPFYWLYYVVSKDYCRKLKK